MVAMGLRIARTHMSLAEVQTLEPPSKRQIAQSMNPTTQGGDLLAGYYASRSEEELDTVNLLFPGRERS